MLISSVRPGDTLLITLAVSFGVTLASCIIYFKLRAKPRSNRPVDKCVLPKSWKRIGKIKALYIYPLKSGHYIPVQRAFCDDKGMHVQDGCLFDRSFIVFKEKEKKFISSKQVHHLLLVLTQYKGDGVYEFSVSNQPTYEKLSLNMKQVLKVNNTKSFTLYEDESLSAVDCGEAASSWFSKYLFNTIDANVRLGFNANRQRTVADNHMRKYTTVYDNVNDEDLGVFADMTSFMILNESSLTDLNSRMADIGVSDVSMLQFRGNIIVDGPTPFAEDTWDWLRFNETVILRAVKPCTRCTLTCLHPETGSLQPQWQPLSTLKEYRSIPDEVVHKVEGYAPMFGLYAGAHRTGYVSVGDEVYAESNEGFD